MNALLQAIARFEDRHGCFNICGPIATDTLANRVAFPAVLRLSTVSAATLSIIAPLAATGSGGHGNRTGDTAQLRQECIRAGAVCDRPIFADITGAVDHDNTANTLRTGNRTTAAGHDIAALMLLNLRFDQLDERLFG